MHYSLSDLRLLPLELQPGDIVFLQGDLGAGKTTLTRKILQKYGVDEASIKSPTYTYVQKYRLSNGQDCYHFDLYRLDDYETFVNIGGQEIFEDPKSIKIVEWPEILAARYVPTRLIKISEVPGKPELRNIELV